MTKMKVFALVPDYSQPCLNFLRVGVLPSDSEIDLLLPYNINNPTLLFLSLFVNQIRERKKNLELIKKSTKNLIKLHYPNILVVLFYLIREKIREKNEFKYYNTLRWIQENYSLKYFDQNQYQIVYCFDTAADKVFSKFQDSKKYLESRGCFIDFVLEKNEQINTIYGSYLQVSKDNNSWFEKMRSEVKQADVIVGYSDFHLNQFKSFNNHAKSIKYYIPSKFQKSQKIKSVEDKIKFCFIGSLVVEKGIEMLLDIWRNIQLENKNDYYQHELILIGPCHDEKILEKIGDTTNVMYKGKLNSLELSSFLESEIHVLIAPTHYDSFGMIINEAISLNIPIITSEHCGASEQLNNQSAIVLLDSFEKLKWKNAILDLMKNPMRIKEKSKNLIKINV